MKFYIYFLLSIVLLNSVLALELNEFSEITILDDDLTQNITPNNWTTGQVGYSLQYRSSPWNLTWNGVSTYFPEKNQGPNTGAFKQLNSTVYLNQSWCARLTTGIPDSNLMFGLAVNTSAITDLYGYGFTMTCGDACAAARTIKLNGSAIIYQGDQFYLGYSNANWTMCYNISNANVYLDVNGTTMKTFALNLSSTPAFDSGFKYAYVGAYGDLLYTNSVDRFIVVAGYPPDITSPSVTSIQVNNSVPHYGETIYLNWTLEDNTSVDVSWLQVQNGSGSYNVSYQYYSSQQVNPAYNLTIADSSNIMINLTAFANDTSNNNVSSSAFRLNLTNNPVISSMAIQNLPLSDTDQLNCTYSYLSYNSSTQRNEWFKWYLFGNLSYGNNSQNVSAAKTTTGQKWICSVMGFDGTYNATGWSNSSEVTIADNLPPVLNENYTSTGSVTTGSTIEIFANVTDVDSSINYVYSEITDPNSLKANYTMVLDSGALYKRTFTTSIVGTHFLKYYFADTSGNSRNSSTNILSFSVTAVSGGVRAGGGGGGPSLTIIKTTNETKPVIDWGIAQYFFTILYAPSSDHVELAFKNIGETPIRKAKLEITPEINVYLQKACVLDLLSKDCVIKDISVDSGETKILVMDAVYAQGMPHSIEGQVRLKENTNVYALNVAMDRVVGAKYQLKFAEYFNTSEMVALIIVYFIGISAIFTALYIGAKMGG